jgi:hypothetical protein
LIESLHRDPSRALWDDLWGCLCHQGTVYSASYHALALLCELAKASPPADRLDPLMLVSKIIAADDLYRVDRRPVELIAPLIPELRRLVDESMASPGLDPKTFIYHLEAASALAGDLFWGRHLDHLADDEFPGICPACKHDLYLVIGARGFFVTAVDYARLQDREQRGELIAPAAQHDLADRAAWLHATAIAHRQPLVASWIRHIFGATKCPACNSALSVADAIAEHYSGSRRQLL